MKLVEHQQFDEERAFYGQEDVTVRHCTFRGPADGESAFKECRRVMVESCLWELRYPFWHDEGLTVRDTTLTAACRAALWYSKDITVTDSRLHGIKALRECADVTIRDTDIVSPEFGWSTRGLRMEDTRVEGEYAFLRGEDLRFDRVELAGKYSFQYVTDAVFENCRFDTKDAFWHGRNILVRDSVVKGEYLAWYAEDITFERCTIIGTQPFCYCKNLRLVDCEMVDTDLSFEKSTVEATLTAPIDSIKNPLAGTIRVPAVGEVIMDDPAAAGRVIVIP